MWIKTLRYKHNIQWPVSYASPSGYVVLAGTVDTQGEASPHAMASSPQEHDTRKPNEGIPAPYNMIIYKLTNIPQHFWNTKDINKQQ